MYAILISAILYLLTFIYPSYLYPCVCMWMIPLLVTDTDNKYGYTQGFVWGMIFFGGHLTWLAFILQAKGCGCEWFIMYLVFVAYLANFAGFWLLFKKKIIDRYAQSYKNHKENRVVWCLTWIISTVIFIFVTCSCSFAIFDCFEGYYLANPLLALVSWPYFLQPIYYFGELTYWMLIVCINIILVQFFIKYDSTSLIFLFFIFLLPSVIYLPEHQCKINKNYFLYVQPSWNNFDFSAAEKFYAISSQLDIMAQKNPNVTYILMPESAFGHDLVAWQDKLSAWTDQFTPATTIFIGAHRHEDNKIYNSLYHIQDGKIIHWYDKQHLIPLTERASRLLSMFGCLHNLLPAHEFAYPLHDQSTVYAGPFQLAICSELFCNARRFTFDRPILFICHDAWLGLDYAKRLGLHCAQLCALKYRIPIIYVGSDSWQAIP